MDFDIHQGFWNQSSTDTDGQLRFWGVKGYLQIFDCMSVGALTSALFKGQLYSAK